MSAPDRFAHCTEGALLFHDVRWAAVCQVLAAQNPERHAACLKDPAIMNDPLRGRVHCDAAFAANDGSAECTLPDSAAGRLDALLREDEQRCAREARAAP